MKTKTWLVVDCHNLCWRAYHTLGYLSYNNIRTGVIYGFLKSLVTYQDLLGPHGMVFCFDSQYSLRALAYPGYKKKRKASVAKMSEEKLEEYKTVRNQIGLLRDEILTKIGFRNVFHEDGYESDDLISSVCLHLPKKDKAIILSSDHDFYQCLNNRVSIMDPRTAEIFTHSKLIQRYGVEQYQWIDVKAIAGCHSDEIEGIKGIGEKTACKFLSGKLSPKSKAFHTITSNNKIWKRNYDLVCLPYEDCPTFTLQPDRVTVKKWDRVIDRYGMQSLRGEVPINYG